MGLALNNPQRAVHPRECLDNNKKKVKGAIAIF